MFELESALRDWTARCRRTETMRHADVEELEQHVRDSLAALTTSGLSAEEAFLVATHRVGSVDQLEHEFRKVNGNQVWSHRLLWMLAGYLLFIVTQLAISALATFSQAVAAFAGGSGATIASASIGITAMCWLAFAIWLFRYSGMQYRVPPTDGNAAKSRSLLIPLGLATVAVAAALMKFGSQIAVARLTPAEAFAQSMFISAYANAVFALLLPIACMIGVLIMQARMRNASVSPALTS